jgi:large conductance mechanosensitive channel
MAVGIIIGAAFGKIIASLVSDVLMPPLGLLLGNMDFSSLSLTLKQVDAAAKPVTLNYGMFLNTIINFLIVAFCMFLVIKGMNHMNRLGQKPVAPTVPTDKTCPECLSVIPLRATRCAQCTTVLPKTA